MLAIESKTISLATLSFPKAFVSMVAAVRLANSDTDSSGIGLRIGIYGGVEFLISGRGPDDSL